MGLRNAIATWLDRLAERAGAAYGRAQASRLPAIPPAAPTEARSLPPDEAPPMVVWRERAAPNLDPGFFLPENMTAGGAGLSRPFAQHPWVYAVVHRLATLIARAPFQVGQWDANGAFQPNEQHPVAKLFARPNPMLSAFQLWYLRAVYLLLKGEAFFLLDRESAQDVPRAVGVVPGGKEWKPVLDPVTHLPSAWVWRTHGKDVPYEAHEVVHFRLPNPYDPLRGLAPMDVAALSAQRDMLADRFEKATLENGSVPGGYLKFPEKVEVTPDQYQEIKKLWEDRHKGAAKAGKFAVVDRGGEFVYPPLTHHDLQFAEGRKWSLAQICAVFGVPPWVIGMTDGVREATGPGMRESFAQFLHDTVDPYWTETTAALDGQFFRYLTERELAARFDSDAMPAMQAARRSRIADLSALLNSRVSLRQASKILDLGVEEEPLWDEPFAPLGVGPLSDLLLPAPAPAPKPPAAPEAEDETEQEIEAEAESAADGAETPRTAALVAGYLGRLSRSERAAAEQRRRSWRLWNKQVHQPALTGYSRAVHPVLVAVADEVDARFEKLVKGRAAPTPGAWEFTADAIDEVLFDLDKANASLVTGMRPAAFRAADLSAAFTSGELGEWTKLDLTHDDVQDFLERRMALLSDHKGGILAHDRLKLAKSLQIGMQKGETIQELRTRIVGFGDALRSPSRTLLIARTESGVIANTTRYLAAQDAADFWTWGTADDEIVRHSHATAEDETARNPVRFGDTYTLRETRKAGVVTAEMQFPQDPAAPAWAVVACRCFQVVLPRKAA